MNIEQRQHPRIDLNKYAEYWNGDNLFSGEIVNISSGGVCLQSDSPIPDKDVFIAFQLDDENEQTILLARPMWKNGNRCGYKFKETTRQYQMAIDNYVQQNLTTNSVQ